jgi:hypothetical protein
MQINNFMAGCSQHVKTRQTPLKLVSAKTPEFLYTTGIML